MTEPLNERITYQLGRLFGYVGTRLRSDAFALWLGVTAGLGAVFIAFSPWVPGGVLSLLVGPSSAIVLVLLALVVAAIGLRTSYQSTETPDIERPFDHPPEEPVYVDVSTVGSDIDEPLQQMEEEALTLTRAQYERNYRNVREELAAVAVDVLVAETGVSRTQARERLEAGTWTDDERAAALLGNVDPPLSIRLSDWLAGEVVERRVQAVVRELRSLTDISEVTPQHDTIQSESVERVKHRGGGIGAGSVRVTDSSHYEETTCTSADATTETNDRWTVGVMLSFMLSAVGFLTTNTPLVLSAVVPLVYAAYGFLTRAPGSTLSVTRTISDTSPVPGEPIHVSLTVENVGDHPIPEVGVVDGVPDSLPVVDGTPRAAESLRPGESVTVTYTVEALRGGHEFRAPKVWTRNVSGDTERELSPGLSASLTCRDPLEELALGGETTPYTGRIPTDSGGQGVEFYATREYQSTDPLKQIDWNFWARTGEPRTIEFRQNRAADVVVLLDDRNVSRQSRSEWSPDAVTLGRHAAVRLADVLLSESNAVGAATVSEREFVAPSRGRDQLVRVESVFDPAAASSDTDDDSGGFWNIDRQIGFEPPDPTAGSSEPVRQDGGLSIRWLLKRLSADVQVLFVSPMLDSTPGRLARRMHAEGHDVTVVSPNVVDPGTPGGMAAGIERRERFSDLRSSQVRVADWPTERPLSIALERAQHRWSA